MLNSTSIMELYNPTASYARAYRQLMMQHGAGYDADGYYVYSQSGEGIGSFLGGLMKNVLPVLSRSIKGAATLAKPHLKSAAKDIVASGSKHLVSKLSEDIINKIENPKRKRRRRI